MKKLVYLFVVTFATSMMISCAGKTASSEDVTSDSTKVADSALVDSALVDSVDTTSVDSICQD